jgi:hypothetical protein
MGYRRKAAVLLLILSALSGASAVAAPMPCQPGSLGGTYLAPAFSCTLGLFTATNFFFSESAGGVDPNLMLVNPISAPTQIGFGVRGMLTANQGQMITYIFSYLIDAPPIIRGQENTLDPTGLVTLQTALCKAAFPCPGGQGLGTLTATTAQPTAQTPMDFQPNLNALGLQNTLVLDGSGGPATSGGFDNITFLAPEPAAILLTASGLLGLLAFRTRVKLLQILLELRS